MPPTDEIVGTPRRTSRAASDANDPRGATKEIRRLSSLIEISQAMAATLNLNIALPQALDILERHHRVVRSAITLLDEETGELSIKASLGIAPDGQRVRYRLGEGITGRVVESGKPIVVPEASREPLLLNRAANPFLIHSAACEECRGIGSLKHLSDSVRKRLWIACKPRVEQDAPHRGEELRL